MKPNKISPCKTDNSTKNPTNSNSTKNYPARLLLATQSNSKITN